MYVSDSRNLFLFFRLYAEMKKKSLLLKYIYKMKFFFLERERETWMYRWFSSNWNKPIGVGRRNDEQRRIVQSSTNDSSANAQNNTNKLNPVCKHLIILKNFGINWILSKQNRAVIMKQTFTRKRQSNKLKRDLGTSFFFLRLRNATT